MSNCIRSFLHPLQSVSIERYRTVLGIPKTVFFDKFALYNEPEKGRRVSRYSPDAVSKIEALVNNLAVQVEDPSLPAGQRLKITLNWAGQTESSLARHLGISREYVRRMGAGLNRISNHVAGMAEFLDVPPAWLETGDPKLLPADSYIGVRCGQAHYLAREAGYEVLVDISEKNSFDSEKALAEMVERLVREVPAYADVCRKAGGRWHLIKGRANFVPWVPIEQLEVNREPSWSAEIEQLIQRGFSDENRTTISVWREVKAYAEQHGLPYPTEIAMHKRVAKAHRRLEKFGLDPSYLKTLFDTEPAKNERMLVAA